MEAEVRPSTSNTDSTLLKATHPLPPSPEIIYRGIANYPWDSDDDFLEGLDAIIAGTNGEEQQETEEDTILHSKCFYFQIRYQLPDIDWKAYKSWLRAHPEITQTKIPVLATSQPQSQSQSQSQPQPQPQATIPPPPPQTQPEPPYPTSFAQIVDLITTGQPIPGIEQIPDTVLDVGASPPNLTPRRRKPWEEKDADAADLMAVKEGRAGGDSAGDTVPLLRPLPPEMKVQEDAKKVGADELDNPRAEAISYQSGFA